MALLKRVFALSRFRGKNPRGDIAGHVIPTPSTQRAILGLKDVDLKTGIMRLRLDGACVSIRVAGIPLQHFNPSDVRRILGDWHAALNGMPENTNLAFQMRSQPGGLEEILLEDCENWKAQTPGSGLARLAEDSYAHDLRIHRTGFTRRNSPRIGIHYPEEDDAGLLADAASVVARCNGAKIDAELITGNELELDIALSWQPGVSPQVYAQIMNGLPPDDVCPTLSADQAEEGGTP